MILWVPGWDGPLGGREVSEGPRHWDHLWPCWPIPIIGLYCLGRRPSRWNMPSSSHYQLDTVCTQAFRGCVSAGDLRVLETYEGIPLRKVAVAQPPPFSRDSVVPYLNIYFEHNTRITLWSVWKSWSYSPSMYSSDSLTLEWFPLSKVWLMVIQTNFWCGLRKRSV